MTQLSAGVPNHRRVIQDTTSTQQGPDKHRHTCLEACATGLFIIMLQRLIFTVVSFRQELAISTPVTGDPGFTITDEQLCGRL